MLKYFSVKNYRGFYDTITWDLTSSTYDFNTHIDVRGILKNGIVIGENGSGKSNLGLAIFDIVYHLSDKYKQPDYYDNYISAGSAENEVSFEYLFDFDGVELRYNYKKNRYGELTLEELYWQDVLAFRWYALDEEKGSIEINPAFKIDYDRIDDILLTSLPSSSLARILYSSTPLESGHYLILLKKFVDNMLWVKNLDGRAFIGFDTKPRNIYEFIIKEGLLEDYTEFLNEISNQRFRFSPASEGDDTLYCLYQDAKIDFVKISSTGTKALTLLYFWLKQIDRASFVFVDEFDAFYHFALAYKVCQKIFNLERVQVFLSSHDTSLITNELLRPDAYFIIDGKQIKPLYQLTEKELREAHSLERLYRGGGFKHRD